MRTKVGFPASVRCATRPSTGISSLRSSSRFENKSAERLLNPVILPSGRARLPTNVNGSEVAVMTIGIVSLACLAANAAGVPRVMIRSQFKWTSSVASSGKRSERPSADRYSMIRFRPSICPSSRNACRNASKFAAFKGRDVVSSRPMRWTRSGCCARAASGHAMTEPLRSVMNSRRFIGSPRGSAGGPETR
jgi:hypothetical protein